MHNKPHYVSSPDTDTENRIFTHKNGLLSGNNFPVQYPSKFQRDPYMIPPQQQGQVDPMYREPQQMTRNDWSQMLQPQLPANKIPSPVWPVKIEKQAPIEEKAARKKGKSRDSEYSEEYTDVDGSQAESDDATTTETPKKVRKFEIFISRK